MEQSVPVFARREATVLIGMLLALVLAACSTDGMSGRNARGAGERPATSASVVGPPASAVPTSTAPQSTEPIDTIPAAWRIDLDGMGPIKLGMTLAEASAASGETLEIVDAEPGPCNPTLSDLAMIRGKYRTEGQQIFFGVQDGVIVKISTKHPGLSTTTGINARSSADDVRRAYPTAQLDASDRGMPPVWRVIDPRGHQLVFLDGDPVYGVTLLIRREVMYVGSC